MPEFGSAFSGMTSGRKLTDAELIRAIRFMIAAEYEAIQLYMQLSEATDNKLAIEVLREIADEERVHAGEFLRLLKNLAPDEAQYYKEGEEEVKELEGKLKF
ncbi:MAG: ferritin family protein [Dehalococcoidales bacterium]|jgi:rubrerythrin|nr:ferritin family protein [Dehalococcoidales bacterium]MDD5604481.1 ferritin family protein [Dehalococcoidales bacterium]MDX9985866.1 ferritin family protein [Dehalococcoidales bacterium]NLE89622.1 rubrerythrin [Dehalococcoidales bacterium]